MRFFVVGLTNENPSVRAPVYKQYHHVQYNDTLPAVGVVNLTFPPSDDMFRYLIVQNRFRNGQLICLGEVKVFERGLSTIFYVTTAALFY